MTRIPEKGRYTMNEHCSRRTFIGAVGAAAGAYIARPSLLSALDAPASRVAVGLCRKYDEQVPNVLSTMFDQLGGLEGLVRGKTVAIKLNLTSKPDDWVEGEPPGMTHWVNNQVVASLVYLLGKAGARRIRLLESSLAGYPDTLEDFVALAGWKPKGLLSLAPKVEFENTNFLGSGKTYARFMVPGGGLMYKGYDLNQSYMDCDVFISLAKLKQHGTTGVTLSMKNCFGMTPCTIYGDEAPEDEPSIDPIGLRASVLHSGYRLPPKSAPQPVDTNPSHDEGFRVPRILVDLVAARPIHLAIIDGIYTITGGAHTLHFDNMHRSVHPGLLIAGLNCVCTDAVATALMGFDPMADRGKPPFENCDSTLRIAEEDGIGTRDLSRIEVVGTPISKARFRFPALSSLKAQ
jgi:uncharacterized protein (DUF362 family)